MSNSLIFFIKTSHVGKQATDSRLDLILGILYIKVTPKGHFLNLRLSSVNLKHQLITRERITGSVLLADF